MEAIEAILSRRSTRKYKLDVPERGMLEKVVEAGRFAPSGSNSQTSRFLVVRGRERVAELDAAVEQAFASMNVNEGTWKALLPMHKAASKGRYSFSYNAPALIVVCNKVGYFNNVADSVCAAENMLITANALGLGACYVNQPRIACEADEIDSTGVVGLLRSWGMGDDEVPFASISIGWPDTMDGLPNRMAMARKGNPVMLVE